MNQNKEPAVKKVQQKPPPAEIDLYQPVKIMQKVPFGVDPKTVFCLNFKNKNCNLGLKCKFSHSIQQVNDSQKPKEPEKKPLYETSEVVEESGNQTDIICKYFLEAVEKQLYGWFWECPTVKEGQKCIYKHVLPPGYELKKQVKEVKSSITIEELIENKRKLLSGGAMVTLETFTCWKQKRQAEKELKAKEGEKVKQDLVKRKIFSGLSGREMFQYNPELAVDADIEDVVDDMVQVEEDLKDLEIKE